MSKGKREEERGWRLQNFTAKLGKELTDTGGLDLVKTRMTGPLRVWAARLGLMAAGGVSSRALVRANSIPRVVFMAPGGREEHARTREAGRRRSPTSIRVWSSVNSGKETNPTGGTHVVLGYQAEREG